MVFNVDDDFSLLPTHVKQKRELKKSALYVWGYNGQGQTSHDVPGVLNAHFASQISSRSRSTAASDPAALQRIPQRVPACKFRAADGREVPLVSVACGLHHSAAVGADGSLFTWGANEFGQLGDGSETNRRDPYRVRRLSKELVTAVACGDFCTAAISKRRPQDRGNSGRVTDSGTGTPSSSSSSSNGAHEEQWGDEGRLWVWGQNQNSNFPRLFLGAFPPKTVIKMVSCGSSHAAAVSQCGLLQTWGYNEFGQLGNGRRSEGLQRAQVISVFDFGIGAEEDKDEGERGGNEQQGGCRVVAVACGDFHTAAMGEKGELFTWGLGESGQLGHVWLRSLNGRAELRPRRVAALESERVKQVACGRAHSAAVTERGALYIWGGAAEGQLGLGNFQARSLCLSLSASDSQFGDQLQRLPSLLLPRGVREVACGKEHTLAALEHDQLLGWGYNGSGQAAGGTVSFAWTPTPLDWCVGPIRCLAAGGGHSAVLTAACSLKELCELQIAEIVEGMAEKETKQSMGLILMAEQGADADVAMGHCFDGPRHDEWSSCQRSLRDKFLSSSSSSAAAELCLVQAAGSRELRPASRATLKAALGSRQHHPPTARGTNCGGNSAPADASLVVGGDLLLRVVDQAGRLGADSLVRYCKRFRETLRSFAPSDGEQGSSRRTRREAMDLGC